MQQLRISLLSNAGGAAKSTLAAHLGYCLGTKGYSVALLDLDPQGSLSLFTGLDRPASERTLSSVLCSGFSGDWNLAPAWSDYLNKVSVCQSNTTLVKTINELVLHERGAYALSDRLADYPLPHDILFFDCPATLGPLSLIALSACTHILIPVQLEPKSVHGCAELFTYLFDTIRRLRLRPEPKILGIVPTQFDINVAIHRRLKDALAPVAERMGLHYFPPVRYSTEFKNCSEMGLPLHLFRSKNKAVKDFDPIVDVITGELRQ
jgi:chromosome partitioning protein